MFSRRSRSDDYENWCGFLSRVAGPSPMMARFSFQANLRAARDAPSAKNCSIRYEFLAKDTRCVQSLF